MWTRVAHHAQAMSGVNRRLHPPEAAITLSRQEHLHFEHQPQQSQQDRAAIMSPSRTGTVADSISLQKTMSDSRDIKNNKDLRHNRQLTQKHTRTLYEAVHPKISLSTRSGSSLNHLHLEAALLHTAVKVVSLVHNPRASRSPTARLRCMLLVVLGSSCTTTLMEVHISLSTQAWAERSHTTQRLPKAQRAV